MARFKLELEPQFSCEFLVTENTERQAVSWATNSKKDFLEDLLAEEGVIPEKEYPNVQKILAMSKQVFFIFKIFILQLKFIYFFSPTDH